MPGDFQVSNFTSTEHKHIQVINMEGMQVDVKPTDTKKITVSKKYLIKLLYKYTSKQTNNADS